MPEQNVPFLVLFAENAIRVNVAGFYNRRTQIFEHENEYSMSGPTLTDTGGTNDVDTDYDR